MTHVCGSKCSGRIDGGTDYLICPACDREGPDCRHCGGRGYFELVGCPWKQIGEDVWELLDAATLIEKTGSWPNGGGWANEPAALLAGVQRVWSEIERAKASLRKTS